MSILFEYFGSIFSYILFGAVHELIHFFSAIVIISPSLSLIHSSVFFDIFIGRRFILYTSEGVSIDESQLKVVRHSGWIGSTLIALLCFYFSNKRTFRHFIMSYRINLCVSIPALITALEAISTDLFGLPPLLNRLQTQEPAMYFFCGNFGIILLHSAWLSNGGDLALDILEKMINVTMMRGAQSGGVVTFVNTRGKQNSEKPGKLVAIRTRVVKSKRGDLAKMLRKKLGSINSHQQSPSLVRFFSGHTRQVNRFVHQSVMFLRR